MHVILGLIIASSIVGAALVLASVEDGVFGMLSLANFVAILILAVIAGLLLIPEPHDVTCGQNTYEVASISVEGNYLKVVDDGITYYEEGPCEWVRSSLNKGRN